MTEIATKLHEADGVIFSSPIHNGFLTCLMVLLMERLTFRLCMPGGEIAGFKGCPKPRSANKVRAVGSIVSAGGMPGVSIQQLSLGTGWFVHRGRFGAGQEEGKHPWTLLQYPHFPSRH